MKWSSAAIAFFCVSAFGNELLEMTFDERVRDASVVLVGLVEGAQPHTREFRPAYSQIKVESVLKGAAPSTIRLETYGEIAEESVFVEVGRRYLFQLTSRESIYRSVNGQFGVTAVDGKPVVLPAYKK